MLTKTCDIFWRYVENGNNNSDYGTYNGKMFNSDVGCTSNYFIPLHVYFTFLTNELNINEHVYDNYHGIGKVIRCFERGGIKNYHVSFKGGLTPKGIEQGNKIVATTDETLIQGKRFDKDFSYPKPTKEWMEYFMDEFNKNHAILRCEIECEDIGIKAPKPPTTFTTTEIVPKTNDCWEINILPKEPKETFTKEDMEKAFKLGFKYGDGDGYSGEVDIDYDCLWENL